MTRWAQAFFALVAVVALPLSASAQPAEGFSSDRPGYANSTAVAPVLRPIMEMGVGFTVDDGDPETISAPNFLVRFGLSEWLELRLAIPNVTGIFAPGPNDVAFGDTTVGLKVAVSPSEAFSTSLVPSLSIATSGGANTGRIEWNWAVTTGILSIGGNLAAGTTNLGAPVVQGEGSLAVGIAASDTLSIYGQFFMIWPRNIDPLPYIGAGLAAQVAERFQIDTSIDIGLTDATTRVTVGAGFTVLVGDGEGEAEVEAAPARRRPAPAAQPDSEPQMVFDEPVE